MQFKDVRHTDIDFFFLFTNQEEKVKLKPSIKVTQSSWYEWWAKQLNEVYILMLSTCHAQVTFTSWLSISREEKTYRVSRFFFFMGKDLDMKQWNLIVSLFFSLFCDNIWDISRIVLLRAIYHSFQMKHNVDGPQS